MKSTREVELLQTYARHPLSARTILERVLRQRGSLEGITELDLAVDEETAITDQNHVGGAAFVEQLAEAAGVTPDSKVADWGCGLGGPARLLAFRYGCQVDGVDFSPERIRDAEQLTSLVHLEGRVRFQAGDALSMEAPESVYDVIWGQGAWMHVGDKDALFSRCAMALRPGGTVALEDVFLARAPCSEAETAALSAMSRIWMGDFLPLPTWIDGLSAAGFEISAAENLSKVMAADCRNLLDAHTGASGLKAPETELLALRHGAELSASGVIGYVRIIATAPG